MKNQIWLRSAMILCVIFCSVSISFGQKTMYGLDGPVYNNPWTKYNPRCLAVDKEGGKTQFAVFTSEIEGKELGSKVAEVPGITFFTLDSLHRKSPSFKRFDEVPHYQDSIILRFSSGSFVQSFKIHRPFDYDCKNIVNFIRGYDLEGIEYKSESWVTWVDYKDPEKLEDNQEYLLGYFYQGTFYAMIDPSQLKRK